MAVVVKKSVKAKRPVAAPKKVVSKRPVAKKAAPKKSVTKKAVPAKAAPKKPVLSKAQTKKSVSKKILPVSAPASEKKEIKRVPPRIVRKAAPVQTAETEYTPIDTAKAVAFGSSIAERMKLAAARVEEQNQENDIRLSRRPTTRTQGTQTEKFPEADLREFRKRLLAAREQAMNGANAMRATGFNESEDHEADGGDGTNQTLRLQALGQVGNINRTIQQIEEALHRIDDGSYGVCTSCGQLIRKPRLLNQPFVQTCMECQNEMERGRR